MIITLKEAKANDLKRYFTGLPCIKGHLSERKVNDNHCVECNKVRQRVENLTEEVRISKNLKAVEYNKNVSEEKKKERAEYFLQWARENTDKVALKRDKWKKNNPDKVTAIVHKRRALENGAEGTYSDQDIKQKFHDQFGQCNGCNREFSEQLKYTVDHIIPLSKGGTNWPDNIQLLCGSCNFSKGPKLMDEWLQFKAKI